MSKFGRVLVTGAAGGLGKVLRAVLPQSAEKVRLSDRSELGDAAPHEEIVVCDLSDRETVFEMTKDVDIVIHMGGAVGPELPFDVVLQANYLGFHNVYEGCRLNGVKRVIWGSSNHAIGFYPRTQRIDASVTTRPDSDYGVSKVFGEAMAQYYWDKYALESVSLRIGSCFPKPVDRRMLTTWLSYPDFVHLVECAMSAPRVEHTIVYGVSANDSQLWDNRMAAHLGYVPKDNAEVNRAEVEMATPPYDRNDLTIAVHGGSFAAIGYNTNR